MKRHRTDELRRRAPLALAVAWLLGATEARTQELELVPLSPGDRIEVVIADDDLFSGRYQIDLGGHVGLPHVPPVSISGLRPKEAAVEISRTLEREEMLPADFAETTVRVLSWATIDVTISGAVFFPGVVRLEEARPATKALPTRDELPGAEYPRRFLTDAIGTIGGVRPDADLANVQITRHGHTFSSDLTGYLSGKPVTPIPLAAGDEVFVPSTGEENPAFARPSRITPPGIKIFASNLIVPSESNALAAIGPGISVRYGSRFSQGVVAANCTGGVAVSNARRRATLVRTNPLTGETVTWESRLEELLSSPDAESNPILFEGDAIVCYDSRVTNLREIFRTLTDIVLPFHLGLNR